MSQRLKPARQRGYVLVTVLVALVLLALLAARLDARLAAARALHGGWSEFADTEAALAAAADELLFAILSRPLTQAGFGAGAHTVRVDGRPYRLPSGIRVSVQDQRGLISPVGTDAQVWRRFLLRQGVPDREIGPLLDKLADYMDTNDLHRLNGAERDQYLEAGLPPPRNDWLLSPYELRQVMGWRDRPALWERAGDVFTLGREGWINPNTAPRAVLLALPGATPEGVERLLTWRETQVFGSAESLLAVTGIRLDDDPVAFHPGRLYRLRLWPPTGPGAVEYSIILTPNARRLPWQTLETRSISRPTLDIPDEAIAEFPFAPVAADTAGREAQSADHSDD